MSSTLPSSSSSTYAVGADAIEGPRDLAALHRDIWAILRTYPKIFVALPALVWFPADLFSEWVAMAVASDDVIQQIRISTRIAQIANVFIGSFVTVTLLSALRQIGRGEAPTLSSSTKDFGALFAPIVGVTFLGGALVGFGMILFIIPGLVLLARYALVAPVVVFEGLRGMEALRRSQEIVRDAGAFRVFGYGLAGYLIYFLLALMPAFGVGFVTGMLETGESALLNALSSIPFNILISGLIVGVAMLYADAVRPADQYPVGHSLIDANGTRRTSPSSTGVPGLVVVTLCAALSLPVIVFVAFAAFSEAFDDVDVDVAVEGDVEVGGEGVGLEVEGDVVIGAEDVAAEARDVDDLAAGADVAAEAKDSVE